MDTQEQQATKQHSSAAEELSLRKQARWITPAVAMIYRKARDEMKAEGKAGPHWWRDPRFDGEKPACSFCLDERFVPCGPTAIMMPCNVCNLAAFVPSEEELVRNVHIPEIHYESTLDNWQPQNAPALRACREYVALWPPEKPFLTIYGGNGTGKTHLACAVLQVVAGEFRQQSYFWPVIDLMARMRAAMNEGSDETPDHIEQWTRDMKMLVLDDLGAIKETGWTSERISGIVDYRWRNKLPTVFTFDVGLDSFIPRIRSRIAGPQTATVIRLEGADKRLGAYSI